MEEEVGWGHTTSRVRGVSPFYNFLPVFGRCLTYASESFVGSFSSLFSIYCPLLNQVLIYVELLLLKWTYHRTFSDGQNERIKDENYTKN